MGHLCVTVTKSPRESTRRKRVTLLQIHGFSLWASGSAAFRPVVREVVGVCTEEAADHAVMDVKRSTGKIQSSRAHHQGPFSQASLYVYIMSHSLSDYELPVDYFFDEI